MSDGAKRFFNINVDTGILLTMLLAGVYFGGQVRADLDNAVSSMFRIEKNMLEIGKDRDALTQKVTELEVRLLAVERTMMSQ